MVSLFTGTVPNLTQSQPDFDTNTQAILDYIASLAPDLNAWVGAYVQDTSSASSTSNSVGTGSKTFTVEAGKGYKVNMPVRASATTGNYMDGIVTAYSGTSLTVNFTAATGSGTFTSWQIFLTIPGSNVTLGSNTFTGDQFVPDEAYDASGWNGDLSVPTKNAVRDKIEDILSSILNATNDSTFASTSSTSTASPEWVNGRLNKNRFTSASQTITTAGALTIAHGLGATPKFLSYNLTCTTADAGFSVGDILDINSFFDANSRPTAIWKDATNIYVRFNNNASVFSVAHKATGALTSLTNSSWNLVINAMI